MDNNKTIWFDFTNVPHVNFLLPVINHFNSEHQIFSIRDFAETRELFEKKIGKSYQLVGSHKGQKKLLKILGSFLRIGALQNKIPYFDVKISVGGDASSIVAKLRGKISVTFDDNEIAPNWRYSKFSDLAFWPESIDVNLLYKQGFTDDKLFRYSGFKEDFYLADYVPDSNFINSLPFKDYVVVRPENIQANYVDGQSISVVPQLLCLFNDLKINVLFLPRYKEDKIMAGNYKNVFMPETAISGMDACYFSTGVFTGAGTIAREAACMGIPAFSFFTGKELLTVDRKMIDLNWLYFSRNPKELIDKFFSTEKRTPDLQRSLKVKKQILSKLDSFLQNDFRA